MQGGLSKAYGLTLSMHTGKKHNYLGVDMEFNDVGLLDTTIITYPKKM